MPIEEVVEVARWAYNNRLGNLMLQSGELRTEQRIQYIEDMVKACRAETVRLDRERRGADAAVRLWLAKVSACYLHGDSLSEHWPAFWLIVCLCRAYPTLSWVWRYPCLLARWRRRCMSAGLRLVPGGEATCHSPLWLLPAASCLAPFQATACARVCRYLLRIETSNPDLYKALHPSAMSWDWRVQCLHNLKEVGQPWQPTLHCTRVS